MRLHVERVPDATEKVYVFDDGALYERGDPYRASLLVSPIETELGAVLIHGATGTLAKADMLELVRMLRWRGYRCAYMDRAPRKGRPPLGEFVGVTACGLKRWRVRLDRTRIGSPSE